MKHKDSCSLISAMGSPPVTQDSDLSYSESSLRAHGHDHLSDRLAVVEGGVSQSCNDHQGLAFLLYYFQDKLLKITHSFGRRNYIKKNKEIRGQYMRRNFHSRRQTKKITPPRILRRQEKGRQYLEPKRCKVFIGCQGKPTIITSKKKSGQL